MVVGPYLPTGGGILLSEKWSFVVGGVARAGS